MTTTPTVPSSVALNIVEQRIGLADVQLGNEQSSAADRLAQRYNLEPRCENRRVAIANSRKAFGLTICEYKPEAVFLNGVPNGVPIIRVVSYFLDDTLVRLDVDAQGDQPLFVSTQSALEADWLDAKQRPLKVTDRTETVWLVGTDELSLSHLESASVIEYRIRDTRLAEKLPWLFE